MANDKILFETPGIDWVELEGQELYSADEKAKMIEEYVSTVKTVEKNQIISGKFLQNYALKLGGLMGSFLGILGLEQDQKSFLLMA